MVDVELLVGFLVGGIIGLEGGQGGRILFD